MQWAFIYLLDDDSAPTRVDQIDTLTCVGIARIEDAADQARRLIESGVELIELCGGFGGAGLGAVVEAVGARIPVGCVFYGVDASAGLQRLFSKH